MRAANMLGLAIGASIALAACAPECPKFTRCDIRDHGCQQQVMKATQCLRGGSTSLPKVTVVKPDELLERYKGGGDLDDEQRDQYTRWNDGLALFDLAPNSYTVDDALEYEVSQTAAAYFDDAKDIVVVDRGDGLSDEEAVGILAHEVVHALQDAEYDLRKFGNKWSKDFDSGLALSGLIEGEAVTYQLLASAQLQGYDPQDLDWEAFYESTRRDSLADAEADPAPVSSASIYFPYTFGAGFVTQYWLARGRAGIDQLFESPPIATREILFGPEPSVHDEQRALDQNALPVLPDTFELVADTSLGAWIARIFAARVGAAGTDPWQVAKSLAADRFSVFANDDGDVIAAWRVRKLHDFADMPWPGRGHDAIEGPAAVAQETYLIAAETMLPAPSDAIAWRASQPSKDGGEDEQAALRARLLRHAGCNQPRRFHE